MPRAPKIKEEDDGLLPKARYQPTHALHFEELNKIWEADRRIPSISSRRAWAEARNLNPVNVHNWWYRRRPLAKKLKLKIPRDKYELDVGVPPIIPPPEEVKKEIKVEQADISGPRTGVERLSSLPGVPVETSSSEACHSDQGFFAKNPLFDELSAEMDVYMRSSSPVISPDLPLSSSVTVSRESSSPLPPSSPPPCSSPSPCILTFPEDIIVAESSDIDPRRSSSDLFPESVNRGLSCTATSYIPCEFSLRFSEFDQSDKAKCSADWVALPIFSTWCLCGYRITYDGCCIGVCSCADASQNDPDVLPRN